MKKLFVFLFCILIFGFGVYYYNKSYNITNDKSVLENKIEQFLNRGSNVPNDISIKEIMDIDNKKYVLFSTDDNFGNAELIRGLNGKYKIEYTERGTNLFLHRVIKTNKTKYFVIFAKNYGMKIKNARVSLQGHDYMISIPQQDYFIAYCPVSNDTKTEFPQSTDFKLYDANNNDITDDVYKEFSK
ncbi:hypothetical protein [Clostridium beijerinckii]|uniref:Uncharacterized protein n=1 Tax=Clostridium beijerinckii TaxID=1520 RepID=A0A1S9N4L7_CLOBE|nr:hypothetical protein [Clostridium beijerinckii]MZK52217.1 hypothetical protein [Clostridium beijerinckii]MZK60265.1 hypothetical protein [Clostridium beijerinckii]MZK70597.1 hypothetical protein [Clostridium beijerinckii]MZK75853.1 hypothetical protein [Clostridium beijerinckii]MZK85589.1 hypothetical protein [Clostridium beijerinckii]